MTFLVRFVSVVHGLPPSSFTMHCLPARIVQAANSLQSKAMKGCFQYFKAAVTITVAFLFQGQKGLMIYTCLHTVQVSLTHRCLIYHISKQLMYSRFRFGTSH